MAAHLLQITLTGSAQAFTANNTPCRHVIVQNTATHVMRVGDSTVTTTKGLSLASAGLPVVLAAALDEQVYNLTQFYVIGTAADLLDVLYYD